MNSAIYKWLITLSLIIGGNINLKSQQMPIYSQYMLDGFIINSAMAGYEGLTTFNLISRQQWLGFDNAPRTISFSTQTRLLKRSYQIKVRPHKENKFIRARKGRVGLGGYLISDRNGYFVNTAAAFTYSYHLSFRKSQFSLGLQSNIKQHKIDKSGIVFRNPDPTDKFIENPTYIPDLNIGCFYYKYFEYYIGFSINNITQSTIKFGNSNIIKHKTARQYYILGGYRFQPYKELQYEPSLLLKTNEGLLTQLDISFKVYLQNKYWMGLSYRTPKTIISIIGIRLQNLYIGYAFDYDFNAFQRFTFGSHEIYMSLKFGSILQRYRR